MIEKHHLGIVDYIVIFVSLLVSAGIGIGLKLFGSKHDSATGYLLAGKDMSKIPVILSIIVTLTSPIALLSIPIEVYLYGTQVMVQLLSMPIGIVIASYVFIPVYYQLGVSTVNEFLEIRYGKYTRIIISLVTFFQTILYMSMTVYGSVLALSTVSDLSVEMSILSMGIICTFYCSLGGLKAVLWTDSYQFVLVFIYMAVLYTSGIPDGGGFQTTFNRLQEGNRIMLFNFQIDFFARYTFWNTFTKGLIGGLAYGVMQIEVQRILSLSSAKKGSMTLAVSSIPVCLTFLLAAGYGAVIYAIYYECDPIINKDETGLVKYEQLVPYYIITKFSSIPGLTGLCISGIFSASLSTVSSALNSLSTITVVDFIKPVYEKKKQMTDVTTVVLAKGLSVFYGAVCVGLTFLFLTLKSLVRLLSAVVSNDGVIMSIFLFGVLSRKGNDKVTAISFILSSAFMSWVAIGSMVSPHLSPILPLSTSNCTYYQNVSTPISTLEIPFNCTEECATEESSSHVPEKDIFILHKISFLWYSMMGFCLNSVLMVIGVLLTGWSENTIPADSKCLSPVTRLWLKKNISDVKIKKKGDCA